MSLLLTHMRWANANVFVLQQASLNISKDMFFPCQLITIPNGLHLSQKSSESFDTLTNPILQFRKSQFSDIKLKDVLPHLQCL